ncbi:MAG: molybdopterin-dependent oxidoreductase [Spirochaetaceae bacterium]|nr:molybdopterin-dependent oxidoreductase [Spirochaetaceae bacterium]
MTAKQTSESLPILSSLAFPDMLFASIIRSRAARAQNNLLNQPNLPAGYRIIAPSGILAQGLSLVTASGLSVFADKEISYQGEPLGLVVGPDPLLCDELAQTTDSSFEALEPDLGWESFSSSQIAYRKTLVQGDPEKAFEKAANVEKAVYHNGVFDHHYSEPMGALAAWEYDKMAIYCASQWPAHVRDSVAAVLKVPAADIVVKVTELGMALDGRLWLPSLVACQAAIAARLCRRPVKILFSRKEDYLYTSKQARSAVTIKSATDANGQFLALDIKIILNIGAYNPMAEELVNQAMSAITGLYVCPSIRLEAYAVRTNILPLGALGSIGSSHAFFAIEAHINHLASLIQKTPAEIKAVNIISKGHSNFGAEPLESEIPFLRISRKLEQLSDYRRKYASYELVKKRDPGCREGIVRGIALTLGYQTDQSFFESPSMNTYIVEVTLDRNLALSIDTHGAVGSEALRAMWKTTAAGVLSMSENDVHILPPVCNSAIQCGPMTLSRGATIINSLVERASRALQKKRFRETLPITSRAQIRLPHRLAWDSRSLRGQPFSGASWCGTAIEIEIDPLTGEPSPLSVWMVIDAGRIIVYDRAIASLRASILNALNLCIGDEFDPEGSSDDRYLYQRQIKPSSYPAINIEFLESEKASRPRGLGELPFVTLPAAFYSALTQAIGVEPRQLPLRGSEILRLLEAE